MTQRSFGSCTRALSIIAGIVLLAACADSRYDSLDELEEVPLVTGEAPAIPDEQRLVSYEEAKELESEREARESRWAHLAIGRGFGASEGASAGAAPQAPRGVEVCNSSLERVHVAIGYYDSQRSAFVSVGWYQLERSECKFLLDNASPGQDIYYRATGVNGSAWGNGYSLCVESSAFNIAGADNCVSRGFRVASFSRRTVGASENYLKVNFTGGQLSVVEQLDVGDGVYVQGYINDELAYVTRIDIANNRVRVRRASDGTASWIEANRIITREQHQSNDALRVLGVVGAIVCGASPESCQAE